MAEQQYALVNGSAVLTDKNGDPVISGFLPEKPDDFSSRFPPSSVWLPVEDVDSQPYRPGRTYRAGVRYQVTVDKVFRIHDVRDVAGRG